MKESKKSQIFSSLCDQTSKLLQADMASIWLLDGNKLILRAAVGPLAAKQDAIFYRVGDGLTGSIAQGKAFRGSADEKERNSHWKGIYDSIVADWRPNAYRMNFIGVPIRLGKRIIGVLKAEGKKNGQQFTVSDQDLLETVAGLIANAVDADPALMPTQGSLTMKRKTCFLLHSNKDSTFINEVVIPVLSDLDYSAKYDDNTFIPGQDWHNEIISEIKHANLIIADLTNYSTSIAYILGLARAWGKNVIPISAQSSILPFDQQRYFTLFYNDNNLESFTIKLYNAILSIERQIINESVMEYAGRKEILGIRVETENENPSQAFRFTADFIDLVEEITNSKVVQFVGGYRGSLKSFFALDFTSITNLLEKLIFFKHEWDKRTLENKKLEIENEKTKEEVLSIKSKRSIDELDSFIRLVKQYETIGVKEIQIGDRLFKLESNGIVYVKNYND